MIRSLFCLLVLLPALAFGASTEVEVQIRRLEAAIAQANQEQQSLHVQFQMMLEVRRAESQQFSAAMPQAGVAAPPMNYEDLARLRLDNESRLRQHTDELNRLYARFREIEQEKQRLRDRLNQLLEAN